jgi:drug/metabolite transporter (DMT)-like permease
MAPRTKAWLQIHVCVVLWGFTAILGRLIRMPAVPLVWWRMVAVTFCLLLMTRVRRGLWEMQPRLRLAYAGAGIFLAIHWLTLYAAIKLSNASVAITCIALGPVFVALVEPKIAARPFDARELLLGIAVVPGVFLVVGGTPHAMRAGIVLGVISAFFVALFSACNKRLVSRADPLSMTCLEMGAGAIFITLAAPLLPHSGPAFVLPDARDAILLFLLVSVCTLLPFVLALVALRHLTAFGSTLAVNLEPVYAIVLAVVLLGEQRELDAQFYLGVVMIVGAVFAYPVMTRRSAPRALG